MVRWLGLCLSITAGMGSIPGGGTKILQAKQPHLKKKKVPLCDAKYLGVMEEAPP